MPEALEATLYITAPVWALFVFYIVFAIVERNGWDSD